MTLHAAIHRVLVDAERPLTAHEIADVINVQRLYVRGDSSLLPASQVGLRARNYPALFNKVGQKISLANIDYPQEQTTATQTKQSDRARTTARESGVDSSNLLEEANFHGVGDALNHVPGRPGVYAIRVTSFGVLPDPFRGHAEKRNDKLIYIGEATSSLRKRLGQELWAEGHGTLCRSIGAILGYRPQRGSLSEKVNKNNYTFAPHDEAAIIRWVNKHLEVSWVVLDGDVHETELRLIQEHGPLFNLSGNPRKLPELTAVRAECRRIANEDV